MAAKRIYGCILFLAIIVLTGNQQCQAARNSLQSPSPSPKLQPQKIHFVLVHGACHGAWCWYKLQTLLESAGHRVTAIDLAASGINTISINDLRTYINYTQPLLDLMESIPEGEKVVLVGHSMGGYDLAFSMEQYPHKISFAVFLTAILPDIADEPSYVPLERGEWYGMSGGMLDNQIAPFGRPQDNLISLLFGPRSLAQNLYQLSPPNVKEEEKLIQIK